VVETIANAATSVSEVRAIEKLKVRKVGLQYAVDLHVQAEPQMSRADVTGRCRWQMSLADVAGRCRWQMSLRDAHGVSGKVKGPIRAAMPAVDAVLDMYGTVRALTRCDDIVAVSRPFQFLQLS